MDIAWGRQSPILLGNTSLAEGYAPAGPATSEPPSNRQIPRPASAYYVEQEHSSTARSKEVRPSSFTTPILRPGAEQSDTEAQDPSLLMTDSSINELKMHISRLQTPESIYSFIRTIKSKMQPVPRELSEAISRRFGECIADTLSPKFQLVTAKDPDNDYWQTDAPDGFIRRTRLPIQNFQADPLINPFIARKAAKEWLHTRKLRRQLASCQSVADINNLVQGSYSANNNDVCKRVIKEKLMALLADSIFKCLPVNPEKNLISLARFVEAPFPMLRAILGEKENSQTINILSRTSDTSRLTTDFFITELNGAPELRHLLYGHTSAFTKSEKNTH